MSSRISNSRKIPGPKKRELGGYTVPSILNAPAPYLTVLPGGHP